MRPLTDADLDEVRQEVRIAVVELGELAAQKWIVRTDDDEAKTGLWRAWRRSTSCYRASGE